MTAEQGPDAVVDLETFTGHLADALQDPTYVLRDDVAPDGFARFEAVVQPLNPTFAPGLHVIRATVDLVSDGENTIDGAAGEVFEITVRRVSR